jgi:putative SOS response-associated peptidase YedK
MCYSAEVESDYRAYVREFGADIDIKEFVRLYVRRAGGAAIKTPKAMDAVFTSCVPLEAAPIPDAIDQYKHDLAQALKGKLLEQRERLAKAEQALAKKLTKTAMEERRKATNLIEEYSRQIADIDRTQLSASDARIFPGWWAPVMIAKEGHRTVVPMRFRCRIPGWTAAVEKKYDGTYCVRLDKLEGSWRKLFGHRHGVIAARRFYENVWKHDMEHRELRPGELKENVRLEFQPNTGEDMYIACLWSLTKDDDGSPLLSFGVITDDPPPEIAATGHNRVPIQIKADSIDAWLSPDPKNLEAMYSILRDRPRPYYEHRILKAA